MSIEDKKFYDPNIDRKSKIYNDSFKALPDGTPLPSIIEISNSGICNRKCSFCPRSDPDYDHAHEFFSNDLHDKLCNDLAEYNFNGIFAYCGFNEPLLKKDIFRDIEFARKTMPDSKIEIVTNGDVLSKVRLKNLYDAGLTTLLISVYDGKKGNYKEDNITNSKDEYGLSKALGEVYSDNCITLRTSIIGHELNQSNGLLEWFLKQKKVYGFKKAFFSGLTTLELSKVIEKLLNKDLNKGIYKMPFQEKINYKVANFMDYHPKNKMYKVVSAVSVIEHGFNKLKFLKSMSKIIIPGGFLMISFDYWDDKIDKLKLKYNRNQDGYKKHKKRDYKSW